MKTIYYYTVAAFAMLTIIFSMGCQKASQVAPVVDTTLVTDVDGNVYHTVKIGTQTWMTESLKTVHYRNGDPVTFVTGTTNWETQTIGAYCNYNDSVANGVTYGHLYNNAVVTDPRNIAPVGWHVPIIHDTQILEQYLGGQYAAGAKLKETGTAHWDLPNTAADNSTGFNGLGAGIRFNGYTAKKIWGIFWVIPSVQYADYSGLGLSNTTASCLHSFLYDPKPGYSIRCIKN
jgi:uncharacterized protein (TIGR02145 family)